MNNKTNDFYKRIILCFAALAFVVATAIVIPYVLPEIRYYRANQHIDNNEYERAYYLLRQSRGHEKSRLLLNSFYVISNETRYYYDDNGELEYIYEYKYNEFGQSTTTSEYLPDKTLKDRSMVEYNEQGKQTKLTRYDGNGNVITYRETEYDENGNVLRYTTYDANNEIVSGTFYEYDENGNITLEQNFGKYTVTSTVYTTIKRTYDDRGNLIQDTRYDNAGKEVSRSTYEYDEKNNKISYADYDADGNVKMWQEYQRDENGNCIKSTSFDSNGNITKSYEFGYDEDGFENLSISYDENGKMISKWEREHSDYTYTTKEYDENGKVIYTTVEKYNEYGDYLSYTAYGDDGYKISESIYTYDENGNRTFIVGLYSNGEVEDKTIHEYDEKGNRVRTTCYNEERITNVVEYGPPIIVYRPKSN